MTTQRESRISGAILTALRRAGVFCFKVHGGPMMLVGLPDIIACVDGRFVALETKTPEKRKNTSEAQKRIHRLINDAGGTAVVVCGVEEALSIVAEVRGEARASGHDWTQMGVDDRAAPAIHVNRCRGAECPGHD